MGVFDTVEIEAGVKLPHFPDDLDHQALDWQTKDIGIAAMATYKLTADGRLFRQEQDRREKTPEEKQNEAEEYGFTSWKEYVTAVKEADVEEALQRDFPLGIPQDTVVKDTFWMDHSYHGTFEFHASSRGIEAYDIYWSYEARFNRGELDEIVFLGERGGRGPDEVIAAIENR